MTLCCPYPNTWAHTGAASGTQSPVRGAAGGRTRGRGRDIECHLLIGGPQTRKPRGFFEIHPQDLELQLNFREPGIAQGLGHELKLSMGRLEQPGGVRAYRHSCFSRVSWRAGGSRFPLDERERNDGRADLTAKELGKRKTQPAMQRENQTPELSGTHRPARVQKLVKW